MAKKFSLSVEFLCPTCAGSEFDYDDAVDESLRLYTCTSCGKVSDYDELFLSNSNRIQAQVDALGLRAIDDAVKELKKNFRGNKYLTLK